MRIIIKVEYRGLKHLKSISGPFIIAANHTAKIDPSLLCFLSYKNLKIIIPIYFPTTPLYYDKFIYRFFIKRFGSYRMPQWSMSLTEYMSSSVDILNNGGNILLFPEGKIVRKKEDKKAKPGIAYLAKVSRVPIIPLLIKKIPSRTFFSRTVYRLSFGESIFLKGDNFSTEQLTDESQKILDTIYSL